MASNPNSSRGFFPDSHPLADEGSSYLQGCKCKIRFCSGADRSFQDATSKFSRGVLEKATAKMIAQLEVLADGGVLSCPDKWNKEAELEKGRHFFAVKSIKYCLRAYGFWFDGDFWVSHWVYKNYDDLKSSDTRKVRDNWRQLVDASKANGGRN